ncbi:TIGR00730 family Rossman fold protein [Caulobacter sp. S45]|uniref:LOG family protein n=1 Tax=Caulobacter sp. S45 TaxID=1641861 RepID=UPI00131CAAF3|nr:TIGR00730 family Rossman fold protein [Caulobacter sp. S45]
MPDGAYAGRKHAGLSICLFCGSSDATDPDFLAAARDFGLELAHADVRLVYGGGGVGLMGAAAKAAHNAGGKVLGVMPDFLRRSEVIYDDVETIVVANMHDRKRIMFEQSDAFAVFPGGIGTLEEVVELLSWRRLELHRKPILFLDAKGFWQPFYDLIRHTAQAKLSPSWLGDTWLSVERVEQVLPAIRAALAAGEGQRAETVAGKM